MRVMNTAARMLMRAIRINDQHMQCDPPVAIMCLAAFTARSGTQSENSTHRESQSN